MRINIGADKLFTETALNCCDLAESFIKGFDSKAYDRIYIGSYFCCNRFLGYSEDVLANVESKKATLVLPILTESKLDNILMRMENTIDAFGNDNLEVVANDIGGLALLRDYNVRKIAGRMISKDKRDLRYQITNLKSKAISKDNLDILSNFGVDAIEFDRCWPHMDLSGIPKDWSIHLHSPLAYVSHGNICDISSVNKRIDHRYRASDNCNLECESILEEYGFDGKPFFRFGKSVCTHAFRSKIKGIHRCREIYLPFEEWRMTL